MGSLTTLSALKGALRIPAAATVHDVRLNEIIAEVESQILADVGLDAFGPTSYNETVNTWPGGNTVFTVKRFPVWGVTALTMSGSLLTSSQFSWERSGRFELIEVGAVLPHTRNDVQVMYTAGLVEVAGTTPANLRRWATLEASLQYHAEPMAGIGEQTIRPVTTRMSSIEQDQVRTEIRRIAAHYIRVV